MLILLDIDGVMIPAKSWVAPENLVDGFPMFSDKAVTALKQLLKDDTTIVLTTSHRDRFTINHWIKIFVNRGLIVNHLIRLESNENLSKKRKDEIQNWLDKKSTSDDFIIIDDDKTLNSLPENLKRNLIQPGSTIGLTTEDLENFFSRKK